MTAWWIQLAAAGIGGFLAGVAFANEVGLWRRRRPRAITVDLVGAQPRDPDDWFGIGEHRIPVILDERIPAGSTPRLLTREQADALYGPPRVVRTVEGVPKEAIDR